MRPSWTPEIQVPKVRQVPHLGPGGGADHLRQRQDDLRQRESLQVSGCDVPSRSSLILFQSHLNSSDQRLKTSHIETLTH